MGTGSYLPEFVLDNSMFEQVVETSDEWIVSRTGIKERRIEQEKYNFEMLGEACKCALKNAGLSPDDIDMIIVSTTTPDYNFPSTACLVQNYIQAKDASANASANAAAFDISAACAGFVFALDIADSYIKSGKAKNILIASGDVLHRMVDYYDRRNCVLFGDGAGAAVLGAGTENAGILASYINCESDGQKPYFIYQKLYEQGEIFDKETKKFKGNVEKIQNSYIWQNGREVMQFVSKIVPVALEKVLTKADKSIDDLKYIILHQANKRIIDYVIEKYNLDPEKVPISIDKYGNTSSSTIPILLHELNAGDKIKRGDLIALVGFGSGLTYGAAVIRW